MAKPHLDILMYHSISDRGGPTSIEPKVFEAQMSALSASGRPIIGLDEVAEGNWPDGAVVLTFDDAFQDFADAAWPVLQRFGLQAVVYVPTGRVGAAEDWVGALVPPRPLMNWDTIRHLAEQGVTFGNHSITHPDLTALDPRTLKRELEESKSILEQEIGRPVKHFAPPYGKSTAAVRNAIASGHATSVGTRLDRATRHSDMHDLPRLEMFYFRDTRHWHRHLDGKGGPYLSLRRGLRAIRNAVSHPSQRA